MAVPIGTAARPARGPSLHLVSWTFTYWRHMILSLRPWLTDRKWLTSLNSFSLFVRRFELSFFAVSMAASLKDVFRSSATHHVGGFTSLTSTSIPRTSSCFLCLIPHLSKRHLTGRERSPSTADNSINAENREFLAMVMMVMLLPR
jgi:hypothetical protein